MMKPEDWRKKNAAFLHDPPAKHDAVFIRDDAERGPTAFSSLLAEMLEEQGGSITPEAEAKRADLFAAGADRPELGHRRQVFVPWRKEALITHPLDKAPVSLLPPDRAGLMPRDILPHLKARIDAGLDAALRDVPTEQRDEATAWWLWRALRTHLAEEAPRGANPSAWAQYILLGPADTRCPDHSLWDHVRVTAALTTATSGGGDPWLLLLGIGPVGAWLREARTTRDLWVSSMLLSELSLAAMEPVIEAWGPDAVISPDLARNVRYDRVIALRTNASALLTEPERKARTRAALIPNRWLAVIPAGTGDDALSNLAERCRVRALRRWTELAAEVRKGFLREVCPPAERAQLEQTWTDQCAHDSGLYVHWAALPWAAPGEIHEPPLGAALPATTLQAAERIWLDKSKERHARFAPFVNRADQRRYDRAGYTFQQVIKRRRAGFDYAPTQHALRGALEARGQARTVPTTPAPAGEACTLCGHRAALGAHGVSSDAQRKSAKEMWAKIAMQFNWDDAGKERLCGVCATRRFLVPPWSAKLPSEKAQDPLARFHHVWATTADEDGEKPRLRLPMPSTAAVAAAPWLREVGRREDLRPLREEVASAAMRAGWSDTFFPRSLPAVGGGVPDPKEPFLRYEPSMLYDGPRLAELTAQDAAAETTRAADRDRRMRGPIDALKKAAKAAEVQPLSSRFAVIAIDGDHLGRLLLGDAAAVRVPWRDVLHPRAVQRLEAAQEPWAQAWRSLLDEPRLMGPSLHAFLNRALTTFANALVPWVVEHVYHGRLIYAGGDDVLALAPACDALKIAARLQELWSAAWVHDTRPGESAWPPQQSWDDTVDGARFQVMPVPDSGAISAPTDGELFPMLGRHQSLSAGIAYAHFKTPLGLVVQAARDALDQVAKERAGRAACAEVLFTRNGPKHGSVFRWSGGFPQRRPLIKVVTKLREQFADGTLPSRLPYKLRDGLDALRAFADQPARLERLARGLLLKNLDMPDSEEKKRLAADLADLWGEGIRACRVGDDRDLGLGNLLLCGALANDEEEG